MAPWGVQGGALPVWCSRGTGNGSGEAEMSKFDVRRADLGKLNSMTKYGSIPTYHEIGDRGMLQPERVVLEGRVRGTEKVDGTNSRVILLPTPGVGQGDSAPGYLIGSR